MITAMKPCIHVQEDGMELPGRRQKSRDSESAVFRSQNRIPCAKIRKEGKQDMQISTKFTIAVHMLVAAEVFGKEEKITSQFLADSIGSNPVIVRNIMLQLQDAGIIEVKRGPGGITLTRPLSKISFLDLYKAVETNSTEDLFRFHENPNPNCPVGKNIHKALDQSLKAIQDEFEKDLASHRVEEVYQGIEKELKKEKHKRK